MPASYVNYFGVKTSTAASSGGRRIGRPGRSSTTRRRSSGAATPARGRSIRRASSSACRTAAMPTVPAAAVRCVLRPQTCRLRPPGQPAGRRLDARVGAVPSERVAGDGTSLARCRCCRSALLAGVDYAVVRAARRRELRGAARALGRAHIAWRRAWRRMPATGRSVIRFCRASRCRGASCGSAASSCRASGRRSSRARRRRFDAGTRCWPTGCCRCRSITGTAPGDMDRLCRRRHRGDCDDDAARARPAKTSRSSTAGGRIAICVDGLGAPRAVHRRRSRSCVVRRLPARGAGSTSAARSAGRRRDRAGRAWSA